MTDRQTHRQHNYIYRLGNLTSVKYHPRSHLSGSGARPAQQTLPQQFLLRLPRPLVDLGCDHRHFTVTLHFMMKDGNRKINFIIVRLPIIYSANLSIEIIFF